MATLTHEQTINIALGEVLSDLGRNWQVDAERVGKIFESGGRPDILIQEPGGWPVVLEAEVGNYKQAEKEARSRLGKRLLGAPRAIDSVIPIVYPLSLRGYDGKELRTALTHTKFEYAVLSRTLDDGVLRFPNSGWLSGSLYELAMLIHRATVPVTRVDALAECLERGINRAEGVFTQAHPFGSSIGSGVANILGQHDDTGGQTRRMAMVVLANALIFHASLSEAEMKVRDLVSGKRRQIRSPRDCRVLAAFQPTQLVDEWKSILNDNYWPIFYTAGLLLEALPTQSASSVLTTLWETAEELVTGGVTKSHDLTGIVFQRLIADRKFLATYYTKPAAAALLAGLALPTHGGFLDNGWGDNKELLNKRIGDFACGTGTLLSTAYQRVSLLHEVHGGDTKALHQKLMKDGLVGLDVLNVAVHLTAAMLASSHPGISFEGECLLTMPYGKHKWGVSVGSLDLLEAQAPIGSMEAAAQMAGGKGQEVVGDMAARVGHDQFDLVIMNPPFTRHGAREGERAEVHNPAFAAFDADEDEQNALAKQLKDVSKGSCAHGHAGLASHFVELAHRKLKVGGTLALVLPMSAISGVAWEGVRELWRKQYTDVLVVTIAAKGGYSRSFSADTGMAECLFVGKKVASESNDPRASFVVLNSGLNTALEGQVIASEITEKLLGGVIRDLEGGPFGGTVLEAGDDVWGEVLSASIPEAGGWSLAGINSMSLAQTAYQLEKSKLWIAGMPCEKARPLPISLLNALGVRVGPHHLDITGKQIKGDGLPQGPFKKYSGNKVGAAYQSLWNHDSQRERTLSVEPDSYCRVRDIGGSIPAELHSRADLRWATANRVHYNLDFQFNSQSLVVAMTERPSLGGRAWPTVILDNKDHEYAFALWCNSTLGLLCHWWKANKTQNGRGSTTVTGILNISTLNVMQLTPDQHKKAAQVFMALSDKRLLPFDQIDEDPVRAELDRALLEDVLGFGSELCAAGGPMELLRKQLAAEPQIHGGKKTRVVFIKEGELAEKRDDRD